MKYTKQVIIILLILSMCTCLTGCLKDEENEKDAAAWREQAEELVIQHIEEKYDFTPEVADSKSNNNDSVVPVSKYIPETIVTMSYLDETFIVVADGSETTTENVMDNYQAEEIRMAFQEYLSEYFQIPVHDVFLEAGHSTEIPGKEFNMQYNFFHEYYDGTNLEEILSNHAIRAYTKIVGNVNLEDLSSISKDSLVFNPKTELLITTHASEADANKCTLGTYFDKTVYTHALYISDAMEIKRGEINEYEFSIGQYDDIYYLITGIDASEYSISKDEDNVSASEWELDLYRYHETGENAYYVSGDFTNISEDLYIFYPEELLPAKQDDDSEYRMGIAYYETQYDKYRYERHEGTVIDGYRVYDLSLKNKDEVSFRVLLGTKK